MSLKRKYIEDYSDITDDYIYIINIDSDDSDFELPVRKHSKPLIVEGYAGDDEEIDAQLSDEWSWKAEDNQPKIWKYTETAGLTINLDDTSRELDFFNLVFDDEFWETIVTETNRYASQTMHNKNKVCKMDEKWFDVDCDEIKIYFALCIIMAQVKKPNIQMNWSKRAVIETPIFNKTMPLMRFLQITRFLHFSEDISDDAEILQQIRPTIDYFNRKFKEIYTMEENIAVEESVMRFNGASTHKQLNASTRTKFGIKFHKLCESSSGYCYDFKLHANYDYLNPEDGSANEVMELSQSVLHKGHTLYLDDQYSSLELFLSLIRNKTNAVGIIHSSKKYMPRVFTKTKLEEGEYKTKSCNGILALKWRDKRDVYIISTKHENGDLDECSLRPKCVADYFKSMTAINRQDQMLAAFPIMRKYMKGYRRVFYYIFDLALFNSFILYKKIHTERSQTYAEFRIDLAESLLNNMRLPDYKRQARTANGDPPQRLQAQHWGHFPKHIDPTPLKKRPARACKVCTRHKKRSETTWECKKCLVPLHIPDCFERYHTVENY